MSELTNEAHRSGITFAVADTSETSFIPLWCSAAMVLDNDAPIPTEVATSWFGAQGLSLQDVGKFCTNELDSIARWMRYGYRVSTDVPARLFDVVPIRAMRYSQYVFAAADIADTGLLEVLGESYGNIRRAQIERVRGILAERSNRMLVVELEHAAVLKTMSPDERARIVETLASWEFERLLLAPGKTKTTAAQDRLAELSGRNSRSAILITEVMLLFIALTSLFGTSVALMQYGRQMVTDPNFSSYAQESGSILDYVAGFSTDGLLVTTLLICTVLAAGYITVKWRNR
ncbi:hypothetical protein ACTWPB_24290 [Nocardia sp. IBHARD005]|uniref:hypothetical protein n=1 Tax=Nocardia sp. IBHARD005 TaxID=3457765 RepID=UPI00405801A7